MRNTIVLDANVMIAATQPSEPHFREAQRLIRVGALKGGLAAHPITIAESAVGAARSGRASMLRAIYEQLGIEEAHLEADSPWQAAELRASHGLTIPDAFVLATALQLQAHLATFDRRLAAAAAMSGIQVPTVM